MTADSITRRYLRLNPKPLDVGDGSQLLRHRFEGRYLSRPLFCSQAEIDRAYRDVAAVLNLVSELAAKTFGGDYKKFAEGLGLTGIQAEVVGRYALDGPFPVFRADLFRTRDGFVLLELNTGSAIGGWEISDLYRLSLENDAFANFAQSERLNYIDPFSSVVKAILDYYGTPKVGELTMALIDWPGSYESQAAALVHRAKRFTELGIRTLTGSLDDLRYGSSNVTLVGEKIDIVYRLFMIDDIRDAESAAKAEPLLGAAKDGKVALFTSLDAEALGSKAALALLSDPDSRAAFSDDDESLIQRMIPWTRRLRPGETTTYDGKKVDLLDYTIQNRHDLVIKPSTRHSGLGVLPGWSPEIDDRQWRLGVNNAADEPYVVQRRVRPAPELFPTADGQLVDSTVNWGFFGLPQGFSGLNIRAALDANAGVVNVSRGRAGCCFIFPDDNGSASCGNYRSGGSAAGR